MGEIALRLKRLNQRFKGQILMSKGRQTNLAHAGEENGKGRLSGKIEREGQHIHKETDEVLGFREGTVGNGGSDIDEILMGIAEEEREKGRKESHEERGILRTSERAETGCERRRDQEGEGRTIPGLDGRARVVERQIEEQRTVGEEVFPEIEQGIEDSALKPGTLPDSEIGILDRERRKRIGETGGKSLVESGKLTHQHAHRPLISDNVVDGEGEDKIIGSELEENSTQERAAGEIKRQEGLLSSQSQDLLEGARTGLNGSQRESRWILNTLEGLAGAVVERGAQRLMAGKESGESLVESGKRKGPLKADEEREIVEQIAGSELIEEPETLLGERQREGEITGSGRDWRRRQASAGLEGESQAVGLSRDGGELKEIAEGEIDLERLADKRIELSGEQRMAAEIEEIVEDSEAGRGEDEGPEIGEGMFEMRARGSEGSVKEIGGRRRRGKRLAVELTGGRERESREEEKSRREHIVGEPQAQEIAEIGGRGRRRRRGRDKISGKEEIGRGNTAGEDSGLKDEGMRRE